MPLTADAPAVAAAPVRADDLIYFPHGFVGCESWKRFVLLVDEAENLPVALLSSVDDPAVGLLVTDPALIAPGYSVPLSTVDRAELELDPEARPVVYCTLTVAGDGQISANLLGPLVINPAIRRGKQLVLTDSPYSTRHPVGQLQPTGAEADACSS
jgi:flagellar assembly factor FliW